MKILFLVHDYYKYNQGGAELQIKYMIEYLNDRGFDIHYLFLHDKEMDYIDDNIHLYSIKESIFAEKIMGKFFYHNRVLKKLKEIKPDIIYHAVLSNFVLPAIEYSKTANCKVLIHLVSSANVKKRIKFSKMVVRDIIEFYGKTKSLKRADKIIAQAKYQDELLQKNFDREADLMVYNSIPVFTEKLKKGNKVKIIWVANLKRLKQPNLFIELAKKFDNSIEFIMIGRDSDDVQIKTSMDEISQINNLKYLGEMSMEEVNREIGDAHILVNTSLYEGFPLTFIQAWMREVPVVSLNVNPDNIIIENRIGFYSKTFDQMVKDIKTLVEDRELREEMGKRAKKHSLNEYSMKNIDDIIEIFK